MALPPASDSPQELISSLHRLAALWSRSGRKREICVLLSYGYRTKQIASVLDISPHTVNTYLTEVYREVGISDRGMLARLVTMLETVPP